MARISGSVVERTEKAVVQFQWSEALEELIRGPQKWEKGRVGRRWGTGCRIAPDLVLTAGHIFFPSQIGMPWNRVPKGPYELAPLMRVNFNYQQLPLSDAFAPEESFQILEMLENGLARNRADYAILRLKPDRDGKLPGDRFPIVHLCARRRGEAGEPIFVIQHPYGGPKLIAEGNLRSDDGVEVTYSNVGTDASSSGAPVMNSEGSLIGVHGRGGVTPNGGYNSGASLEAIAAVSPIIRSIIAGTYRAPGAA